jgi:hypothetical protein
MRHAVLMPRTTSSAVAFTLMLAQLLWAQPSERWSTMESAHLRLHVPPDPKVDPKAFLARQERAFAQIRTFFTVAPPGRVDYYVWNTAEEARRELGRAPGFAKPAELLVHAVAGQTPGHELTHVFVFHAVRPEQAVAFIEEGTAVAFDLTNRDRMAVARDATQRAGGTAVRVFDWWMVDRSDATFYAVAGAFVERLIAQGGRERFIALLKRQTVEAARAIYGSDFDRIVTTFEAELNAQQTSPSAASAGDHPAWPALDTLRQRAQDRMRRDRTVFSAEELRQIETLYQSVNGDLRARDATEKLQQLIEKYPRSNRAGCAMVYLAQLSEGADKEKFLNEAVASHGDAWFGDGSQVGALARAQLAFLYARTGRSTEALKMAQEIDELFPGAVDHSGARLADSLRPLVSRH